MHLRLAHALLVMGAIGRLSTAAEPQSIAVTDLAPEGIPASESRVVSEQLRYELSQTGAFTIVERSRMEEILKEQGFQQSGCTSDACAVEMGQLLGVGHMVTGTLGKAGDYTIVNARIVDVASGRVVVNERAKHSGSVESLIDNALPDIAASLASSFGTYLDPSAAAPADTVATEPAPADSGMSRTGRVVLISTISAAVVGGGVAAIILLSADDDPEDEPDQSDLGVALP